LPGGKGGIEPAMGMAAGGGVVAFSARIFECSWLVGGRMNGKRAFKCDWSAKFQVSEGNGLTIIIIFVLLIVLLFYFCVLCVSCTFCSILFIKQINSNKTKKSKQSSSILAVTLLSIPFLQPELDSGGGVVMMVLVLKVSIVV
jgi:hypothetical protein